MICPCKTCKRQGCGNYHDKCPEYKAWADEKAVAAARRGAEADITNAIVEAHLRRRGKKKK